MPTDHPFPIRTRRQLLAAACAWPAATLAQPAPDAAAWMRRGGVVVALRHALAPGVYDPPGFRLDDCATQRNLDAEGRAQAQRLGAWFRAQALEPARVRSSPWCRCKDTAMLAFGRAQVWPALGSPHGADAAASRDQLDALRAALAAATRQNGRFEVWVTHQFVLNALAPGGMGVSSGQGLVLGADGGAVRLLARLDVAG